MPYRTGSHWQRTIIWEGSAEPDEHGRRSDDALLGCMDDPRLAERIVQLLNDDDARGEQGDNP